MNNRTSIHDLLDLDEENDTYSMVSNLSCPKCHSFVEVYYPNEKTLKDYKKYEME